MTHTGLLERSASLSALCLAYSIGGAGVAVLLASMVWRDYETANVAVVTGITFALIWLLLNFNRETLSATDFLCALGCSCITLFVLGTMLFAIWGGRAEMRFGEGLLPHILRYPWIALLSGATGIGLAANEVSRSRLDHGSASRLIRKAIRGFFLAAGCAGIGSGLGAAAGFMIRNSDWSVQGAGAFFGMLIGLPLGIALWAIRVRNVTLPPQNVSHS